MEFEPNKPFRTHKGEVITMKALVTIISVRVNENQTEYKPDQLTPMTQQEYEEYLDNNE
jgi:hypothetical protein